MERHRTRSGTATLDERRALVVTAVRALEQADTARALASDADRGWASRAAGEALGAQAADVDYVAERAQRLHARIGERHRIWSDVVQAATWRGWVGPVALALAFVAGVIVDEIGAGGRINLLAPPLLGLLAWNFAVYAWLLERWSSGWRRAGVRPVGPLRRLVARVASLRLPRRQRAGATGLAVRAFADDWAAQAAPLYRARAARILHLAAALFAVGVVAGLYLRGIAFEYRASWSSTFLDAAQVRALLAFVLAPGAALTGIAVLDVAHVASIRSGATPGSQNAAQWLHLFAATVAIVVIVPRLVLGVGEAMIERHRAQRIDIGLDAPYFRRLLRTYRAGPVHIVAIPYSYTLPAGATEALRSMLLRAMGPGTVDVLPPVAYDDENPAQRDVRADAALVIALFNAAATPEAGSHVAFAFALLQRPPHALVVLVDEAGVRKRFAGDEARIAQRRAAWEAAFAQHDIEPVFIDLAATPPDEGHDALVRALDAVS